MADRVIRTLIQYGFDEAALNQLRAKTAENRRIIEQTVANIKQLDVVGRQTSNGGLKALDNLFKQSDKNVRTYTSGLKDLRKAATDAEKAAAQAASNKAFFSNLPDPDTGIFAGGGGGRGAGLRRFGAQARQLPSTQLFGNITSDAISNIIRMAGAIGEVTEKVGLSTKQLIGFGGALGALSLALVVMAARFRDVKAAADADINAREAALRLLKSNNQEEIQSRINTLTEQRRINQEIADDAKAQLLQLKKDIVAQSGLGGLGQAEILSTLGVGSGELAAAKQQAEEANKALSETSVELDVLTGVSGLTAQTTESLASAEAQLLKERTDLLYATSDLQNQLNAELQAYQLSLTGTREQLQKQNVDLQTQIAIYGNYAAIALKRAEALGAETEAGKAFIALANEFTQKQNALTTAFGAINQAFVGSAIIAREAAAEKEKREKESADLTRKYLDDVAKIENDYQQSRAAAAKKYGDALVKIAEDAAEAAADALTKLQQERDDLLTDFGRANVEAVIQAQQDRLNNLIDFQRDEARAARDHADEMVRIQRERENEEQDLIASRDFAGLFRLRRDTNTQLQETNRQYERERQERIIAYQQKNEDDARQAAYEQQARDRKFQQQNADLELNYRRELSSIELQRSRALNAAIRTRNEELSIIQNKYVTARTLLYNSTQEELNIIRMGAEARINLARQEQSSLSAIAARMFGGSSPAGGGRYTPTRANSGSLMAGQLSSVNERLGQREMFNGSLLPMGKGLFFPMQNGVVSQGKGDGAQISLTFNVRGNNPEATAQAVRKEVSNVLQDFFG